jgi:peptide/nickel transport system permease protein
MNAAPIVTVRRKRRFSRYNSSARIGAGIVIAFVAIAVAAPLISPYNPLANDWMAILQAPSWAHPMGTDDLGRDVLSRAIWGAQTSLIAGVASVLIALAAGVPLGIFAGWFRGWVDIVVTRLADTLLACPQVMLAIALAMFLGGSLANASIAIGLSTVPVFVRLARAKTIEQMTAVYVEAAISVGNPTRRLLFIHLLPSRTCHRHRDYR